MTDLHALTEIAKIAHELTGVQFSAKSHEMMRARLQKRIAMLKLASLADYFAYYLKNREREAPVLIGMLTTHHSYFFREFSQFEFLINTALPLILAEVRKRSDRTLRVWSAACSRGQEVYSLAMFLDFHLRQLDPSLKFEILGSDIDPQSVEIAKNGVYQYSEIKEIPLSMLGKHWVRGTGAIANYAKATEGLRKNCRFEVENLVQIAHKPGSSRKFDIIFCRNVFIYFNQEQIRNISSELIKSLETWGFLFIGISESLLQSGLPIQSEGPSIYRHRQPQVTPTLNSAPISQARPTLPANLIPAAASVKPLRVVCVDDSPVILKLLGSVLAETFGFEVVGTAANGIEAAEKIQTLRPDVVTLDIHMPVQTGLEYLQKSYGPGHPPVVIVSSVSRDDQKIAGEALACGASDFIEKPTLSNLAERADEIRSKLRCAVSAAKLGPVDLSLDKSFQKSSELTNLEKKLRIIVMGLSHRKQLKALLRELTGSQPPCFILIEGGSQALAAFASIIGREISAQVLQPETVPDMPKPGEIYVFDLQQQIRVIARGPALKRQNSILVYGEVSKSAANQIVDFQNAQLVLEDLGSGQGTNPLMEIASDVVLPTSFAYLSNEFFSRDLPSKPGKKTA